MLLALAAGLALPACGGDEGSSPAEEDASSEDEGTEGDTSEVSADGDAGDDAEEDELDGGAEEAAAPADDAGSAQDTGGAQADAQTSPDLSGTWITKMETLASESLPLVGEIDVQLELAIRLHIAQSAGTIAATFEICDLDTETIPDPALLVVSFPPALIATLRTDVSSSVTSIRTGDALPLPALTIRSGVDMAQQPLDSDADSHPGVTVPANLAGLPFRVYAGLTLEASIASRLTADGKITGTADFSVSGSVFGSDNDLLTEGMLSVAPKSDSISLTATRLAGDVPCSEVLTKLR